MIREQLEKIVRTCEGAVACAVMSFDGVAVDATSGDQEVDVSTISMEYSFVLGQVRKAAEILDVGALEEVAIRSECLTFVIRVLNEEYFIGLALKPNGNFGKGRFLMRMAAPDLLAEI